MINRTVSIQCRNAKSQSFGPGLEAPSDAFSPGDFILTHNSGFFFSVVRFGQRLRYRGDDRKYAYWHHAALIVSENGDLVEALSGGVSRTHLSKYAPKEYTVVRLDSRHGSESDRKQAVEFAEWAVGQRYGWATILSIAAYLLAGCRFGFFYDGQSICSGLVARALERTGFIFDRSPMHIMPADLAKYFDVAP